EKQLYKDPKSRFQEAAQEKAGITPTYEVLEEWGPDHAKHFVVGVFLGREFVAKGDGPSKQAGEEAAARAGLEVRGW
ncbi:ribonuclease III, partial [Candidatus Parcubacteria bacterium]|nr:ribonuclease III [Candidatus Parcubacteria bacterium]